MPARTPQRPKSQKIMRKPKARRSLARPRALGKAAFNIQRAAVEPGNVDPETILAIQRAYGNRATQQLTDQGGGNLASEAGIVAPAVSAALERSRGSGQPLADPIRSPLEQSFQSDFGEVRVHTDGQADQFNHALQAKAFTLGHDIYFSKDNYNPGTSGGKKLIAHDLTHVVRQTGAHAPAVQRTAEEDVDLQTKRVSATDSFEVGNDFEDRVSATRGGGSPLPAEARTFMEPRFGADFSGVRVHSGSEAAELNRSVSAQAFTLGQDIYLGEGKTDVASDSGKRLLAHELTHVVQQTGVVRRDPIKNEPTAEKPLSGKYITIKPTVELTDQIKPVIDELEAFFKEANLRVIVSSGKRDPQKQLDIIISKAKQYGLDKKYPSILTATVDDIESWRGAWDEVLNVKGFIVNPPVAAKCELGKRKGQTLQPSPHISGKAFDLTGASLEKIKEVVQSYRDNGGPISQILVEKVNNAIHVGVSGAGVGAGKSKTSKEERASGAQSSKGTQATPDAPGKKQPDTKPNATKVTADALNKTQPTTTEKKTSTATPETTKVTAGTSGKTKKSAAEQVMDRVCQYDPHIQAASQKFGVPVETIRAIIATESEGKPEASSGAAFGLMQLTKGTWEGIRPQYAELKEYVFSETYWKDPRINILFGTAAFKGKMQVVGVKADDGSSAELAVMAYNAGEGTVKKAMKNAQAAGSQNPAGDCLKPEYLKPAIESTGIYSYYLTGKGKQYNPSVGQDEKAALQCAIDLKYNEISKYPGKVRKYIAAQEGDSGSTPSPDNKEEKRQFVPKQPTSVNGPVSAVMIGTAAVTTDGLNVRQGPDAAAPKLGTLNRGAQVPVTGRAGVWLQITYQGKAAYIHGNYAKFTPTTTASKLNFVDQTIQIGKGLLDQAAEAGKDLWNWVSKQFDQSASKSEQSTGDKPNKTPGYENQRANAYDQQDDNGKRIYGSVMCNVTTLAMQLETLAGNHEKAIEAAVQLLQKNGDKTPVPELRQKQLGDLIMLRFDQATQKNEWPTLLGKEYKQALSWHNQKIPWNQIACALNRIGLEFTAFVAKTEHNEPDDGKGNTQEKLISEEYYRKTLGPLAEKQKATVMLSTQMTSGHIVLFAQALSDGILINDPYGALLKEAGASNYITNGLDKNTAARRIKAAGDQVIKDRLKQNPAAAKNLMAVIAPENKSAAKVSQNIGELNFYTWSEIKKFTIGKWNNVLFKK